jgi:tetratricopeptide (TPR) repeat protein
MNGSPPLPPLSADEARALRLAAEWRVLSARGGELAEAELLAEGELGFSVAVAWRRLGETERSLALALALRDELGRRGERRLGAEVVNLIGNLRFEQGRLDDAATCFEELLEYAAEWRDDEFAARASNNLGILANVRERRDLALVCYQRAVAAYQRLGTALGLAQTHHNLGISFRDLGFDAEADSHFRRAMELAEGVQAGDVVALAENERALLRTRAGDPSLGARLAEHALERFRALGDPRGEGDALRVLAAAQRAAGDERAAAARLDQALALARTLGNPLLLAEVQRDRGLLLRDVGRASEARTALEESAAQFAQLAAHAEAEAVRTLAAELG